MRKNVRKCHQGEYFSQKMSSRILIIYKSKFVARSVNTQLTEGVVTHKLKFLIICETCVLIKLLFINK